MMIFPRAFAFAIDDLGWNEGSDLSGGIPPGPYRAGINRKFDLSDYRCIVDVAKAAGVRIQSLFILSEMDRENILAKYPTTTWQRDKWNNSQRVNDQQQQIMKYVCESSAYMEFGLHGTGHEWWAPDGIQRRAEWYNLNDHCPWPEELVRDHVDAFRQIMAQYDLTPGRGHSFPETFVPCAYSYYWNPAGQYSLGRLLAEAGVKYANTDFSYIPELSPPQEIDGGGFDHGTHVINRLNFGNSWNEYNKLPIIPVEDQQTDIVESHWPNWLAEIRDEQESVTKRYIEYYLAIERLPNRYIAKNTEQLHSQWLYNRYCDVTEDAQGIVEIDNTKMPSTPYEFGMLGNMVLKIKLRSGEHISSALLNNEPIPSYFEKEGFGLLSLPVLAPQKYVLRYTIGKTVLPLHVCNEGTFNVYRVSVQADMLMIELKIYGLQVIRVKCGRPDSVHSDSPCLVVKSYFYDASGWLAVAVQATNMQGSRGRLAIHLSQ